MDSSSTSSVPSPARPDPLPGHSHAHPVVPSPAASVEMRMRKTSVSFTTTFVGLSGFPSETGTYTSSPVVELEERSWSVRIYPGGYDEDSKGFLSCLVAYESRGRTRASFKLTMVNQMNWKNRSVSSDGVKAFCNLAEMGENESRAWGEPRFVSLVDLRQTSNGHCVDDTIVIRVDLVVYGAIEHAVVSSSCAGKARGFGLPRSLQDDLRGLFLNALSADLSFVVGDEIYPAHRFLVCLRSEVFCTMLSSPMREAQEGTIHIDDFDGIIVQEMLRFMYTDQCRSEVLRERGDELLGIACKYAIPGLVALAEHAMLAALNIDNAARTLHVADLCNAKQLRARSLSFIAHNAKAAVQVPGFYDVLGFALCKEVLQAIAAGHETINASSPDV